MSRTKTSVPTVHGRRVPKNWKPVGGRAVAASALIGLVLVTDVAETVADVNGAAALDNVLLWVNAGALVVAAVAFIMWLWRARANAELLVGPHGQRLTREWVIGAWFCPVVNLWFPYQVVVDVWRASAPKLGDHHDGLVVWWWMTFLGSLVFTRFISLAGLVDVAPLVAACVLDLASGVLALLVVRRISDWQALAA
ncbi:DUF4328 domain-containing protein [Kutzneria sp. CA-103260]|uniref:DUF4328 domain-containing protein n=1 Tax=Kutzneria sp. CA-103260 TaxID=2802641 RepID=UPI001BA942BC|nr:DUF4328 domain-containing protein [Kutzneria sp. CA-103260]QUQ71900.1 hypothetical protein JJ691_96870 [Kutzneria sp. CA-103260]